MNLFLKKIENYNTKKACINYKVVLEVLGTCLKQNIILWGEKSASKELIVTKHYWLSKYLLSSFILQNLSQYKIFLSFSWNTFLLQCVKGILLKIHDPSLTVKAGLTLFGTKGKLVALVEPCKSINHMKFASGNDTTVAQSV